VAARINAVRVGERAEKLGAKNGREPGFGREYFCPNLFAPRKNAGRFDRQIPSGTIFSRKIMAFRARMIYLI
ncbi:MAG: hypothetical protein U0984_08715, partial [Prosthecobacter sp.]|nr:hypothetical protein [Prosthecobacter sp.]